MRFAVILRRYSSMSVLFAPSKVTAELLPSAFGVHTKNVSSPLRSGEITNAAIPVFGKAETPPALWRRGVQPGSKNGSLFSPSSPEGALERALIIKPSSGRKGDRASGGRSPRNQRDASCGSQRISVYLGRRI